MQDEKRYLNPKEFGRLLQLSEPTVRRLIGDEATRIRFGAKKVRGVWRFDSRQIEIAMSNSK